MSHLDFKKQGNGKTLFSVIIESPDSPCCFPISLYSEETFSMFSFG